MEDNNNVYKNVFLLVAIAFTWYFVLLLLLPMVTTPKIVDAPLLGMDEMPSSYNEQSDQADTSEDTANLDEQPTTTTEKSYGIGVNVAYGKHPVGDTDELYLASIQPNSPAEEDGLMANDILVEVDGNPITRSSNGAEEASILLRGGQGTQVMLKVFRNSQYYSFSMPRNYKIIQ